MIARRDPRNAWKVSAYLTPLAASAPLYSTRPGAPLAFIRFDKKFNGSMLVVNPAGAFKAALDRERRIGLAFPTPEELREMEARNAAAHTATHRARLLTFRRSRVATHRGPSRAVRRGRVVRVGGSARARDGDPSSDPPLHIPVLNDAARVAAVLP